MNLYYFITMTKYTLEAYNKMDRLLPRMTIISDSVIPLAIIKVFYHIPIIKDSFIISGNGPLSLHNNMDGLCVMLRVI